MSKILIIEDEQILAEKCQEKLLKKEFESVIAGSAQQGIELLKRENPDLVLLDALLDKGKGGIRFLEKMQKTNFVSTPVIAFSDHDDPEIKHRVKDLGANYYIVRRNLTFNRIIDKIKEVLSKSI